MKKFQGWSAVSSIFASLVSVVCMSSMGAALAVAGAAAGMGSMGSTEHGSSGSLLLTRFFESIGLRFLNQIPNDVAQPLLAALLLLSIGAAYLTYREHRRPGVPALSLVSAVAMYVSIYVRMSEPLYFISLVGLLVAAMWGVVLARTARAIAVKSISDFLKPQ